MTDIADTLLILAVQLRKAGGSAFVPFGLSWREAVFLLYIERGYVRPTDLAKEFGMVFPTISGLGAKFAASGLIDRIAREGNAREVTYVLTQKGQDTCRQLKHAWEANLPFNREDLGKVDTDGWLKLLLEAPTVDG